MKLFTPENRLYIYGIVTAAIPLLITLGFLSEGISQQVMLIAAAVLGIASPRLAAKNVATNIEASVTKASTPVEDSGPVDATAATPPAL